MESRLITETKPKKYSILDRLVVAVTALVAMPVFSAVFLLMACLLVGVAALVFFLTPIISVVVLFCPNIIERNKEEEELDDDEVRENYDELIQAVETKYPDETRHETALRYIKSIEARLRAEGTTCKASYFDNDVGFPSSN